jgi:hypothetical protein
VKTHDGATRREPDDLYDELYERFGKPLEREHAGAFVAIAQDGQAVIGKTLLEAAERAAASLGRGVFIYKVGDRAVGRLR